jgi:hypothetical protein
MYRSSHGPVFADHSGWIRVRQTFPWILWLGACAGAALAADFRWQPATPESQGLASAKLEALRERMATHRSDAGLEFIDTSFENASPLWYETGPDGKVQIHLLYDHERASPNRAAGHIQFLMQGTSGSWLTLEFRNLDNVWNGTPASTR